MAAKKPAAAKKKAVTRKKLVGKSVATPARKAASPRAPVAKKKVVAKLKPRAKAKVAAAEKPASAATKGKISKPVAAPIDAGLMLRLAQARELSILEAAIKPKREKEPPSVRPKRKAKVGTADVKKVVTKAGPKLKPKGAKKRPAKTKPAGPAKPPARRASGLKKVVKVLKAALKKKKPLGPKIDVILRPDYSEAARTNRDAERLMGVSRQVH